MVRVSLLGRVAGAELKAWGGRRDGRHDFLGLGHRGPASAN